MAKAFLRLAHSGYSGRDGVVRELRYVISVKAAEAVQRLSGAHAVGSKPALGYALKPSITFCAWKWIRNDKFFSGLKVRKRNQMLCQLGIDHLVAEIANAVDGNSEIEKRFSETDGEVAHLVAHGRAAENELQESAGALNADLENLSRELASKGISWHAKPFSAPMFAP